MQILFSISYVPNFILSAYVISAMILSLSGFLPFVMGVCFPNQEASSKHIDILEAQITVAIKINLWDASLRSL